MICREKVTKCDPALTGNVKRIVVDDWQVVSCYTPDRTTLPPDLLARARDFLALVSRSASTTHAIQFNDGTFCDIASTAFSTGSRFFQLSDSDGCEPCLFLRGGCRRDRALLTGALLMMLCGCSFARLLIHFAGFCSLHRRILTSAPVFVSVRGPAVLPSELLDCLAVACIESASDSERHPGLPA